MAFCTALVVTLFAVVALKRNRARDMSTQQRRQRIEIDASSLSSENVASFSKNSSHRSGPYDIISPNSLAIGNFTDIGSFCKDMEKQIRKTHDVRSYHSFDGSESLEVVSFR